MREVLEYLIKETVDGKIDRKTGANLAKLIKNNLSIQDDIAIIGLHGSFPQAENTTDLWELLINKKDAVKSFPTNRKADVSALLSDTEPKFIEGSYFEEIDKFDLKYFGLTPKEASLMDPNHRLFFEAVIHAIEDAGYGGDKLKGSKTGVCVGLSPFDHIYKHLIEKVDPDCVSMSFEGNLSSVLAGRISHFLDLKGPNLTIDTACSSALTAIHVACNMLQNQEADQVIVGGVKTILCPLEPKDKIGIESLDGYTKTFDDSSHGTGVGEGVAVVILKPFSKAVKDKDQIYAVIKGSAINQDGRSLGLTAPNPRAQEEVILSAWKKANVYPESISYIEAHGTGTRLGDPIEIEGIRRAFSRFTTKKQFCAIGSIKSNLGHTDSLAGLAGFIKCVLALKHKKIPATLHFNTPNREIDFVDSPIYVNDNLQNWESVNFPRRCGVSAFGMSGSNCHIVLEEAVHSNENMLIEESTNHIFTVSALNEETLRKYIGSYREFLAENNSSEKPVKQICFTANTGKKHLEYRVAIIVKDISELLNKISHLDQVGLSTSYKEGIFYSHSKINHALTIDDDHSQAALRYVQGTNIKWENYYPDGVEKISLPLYPFEKNRCWINDVNHSKIELTGKHQNDYTHNELKIGEMWAHILGLKKINIYKDDFFELGGNSLQANILVSKFRSKLKANVSVSNMYTSPTIEKQAELVNKSAIYSEQKIEKVTDREYYDLSPLQDRLYRINQLADNKDLSYNMPFALSLNGNLDINKLNDCWNQLIVRHESLRTYFIEVEGEGKQKVDPFFTYKIDKISLDEKDEKTIMSELITPFDIAHLPLFKLRLLQKKDNEYILFFDIHHIISDGVSVSVLTQELLNLYQGNSLHTEVVQYKDYANWINQQYENNSYVKEEQYWLSEYRTLPEELDLPTDNPRPLYRSLNGDHYSFTLSQELTEKLKRITSEYKTNMFSLLLSAYQILLYRYSNQTDIVIGCPVAGRQREDVQGSVGMFVNMLPIRKLINVEEPIQDYLRNVMTHAINAFEHQEYQVERLIEQLNIPYRTNRNPLYDVVFSYQNFEFNVIDLDEVIVKPIPFYDLKWNSSKFDLNLFAGMTETEDRLQFCLEYSTELFNKETISSFERDYSFILRSFVELSNGNVSDIQLEVDSSVPLKKGKNLAELIPDFNFN
ncbi:condensation domain-containing protein [Paenibacillus taichungensis]|uniref:condensation domain-containing protein n=1 Tax=Paenibacillus taichungensis TaxID=484184 RepID=UPI0038D01B85